MSSPDQAGAVSPADVAIVGAGPVGLVLGILLAQRGRSVVVLEQWPKPYPLPRAVHFDNEVGRILQSCGVGTDVRAISEAAEIYEWRNGEGTTLLRFGRVGIALSGWPFSSMFSQPELEEILHRRATALPALTVRRGVRVHDVEQLHDHVAVHHVPVQLGSDHLVFDQPEEAAPVRARYVIGCDGANSTVRTLLDIPVNDRGFFYDWLIVDVMLDEPRVFDPPNLQVCDPARPTTAVSGGPGRRRWEFMRLPEEQIEDLNHAERAWDLLEPWGVHPGNARLERHAVYTFQARAAAQWQLGRVFLAGDAAHQMPPFAGQGMCAGVRDAANLAWKIDLVLGGHASPDVLSTYDQERRTSANAAIDFSIELGKVICVPDPSEAAARDEAMTAAYNGGISDVPSLPGIASGLIAAGTPLAGELFPQGEVDGRWYDDVFGVGWQLVTDDPEWTDLDRALVVWLESIGGAVINVSSAATDLAAWFENHNVRWAMQRPDFYLFGTASDLDGARSLLVDLSSQLRSMPSGLHGG
jgi:2-polyprenyl-6-methoxyphenol hydroxylase-like FAD-dependent oxidoreductase